MGPDLTQLALLGDELAARRLGPLQTRLHVVLEDRAHKLQLGRAWSAAAEHGRVSRGRNGGAACGHGRRARTLSMPQLKGRARFGLLVQAVLEALDLGLEPLLLIEQDLATAVDLGRARRRVGARLLQLPLEHRLVAAERVAARVHQLELRGQLRDARLQLLSNAVEPARSTRSAAGQTVCDGALCDGALCDVARREAGGRAGAYPIQRGAAAGRRRRRRVRGLRRVGGILASDHVVLLVRVHVCKSAHSFVKHEHRLRARERGLRARERGLRARERRASKNPGCERENDVRARTRAASERTACGRERTLNAASFTLRSH